MENKKLVAVLQRDMNELEELIAGVKSRRVYDALEMEFIHTRAKSIVDLIRLLNVTGNAQLNAGLSLSPEKIDHLNEVVAEIKEEVSSNKVEPVKEDIVVPDEPVRDKIAENNEPEKIIPEKKDTPEVKPDDHVSIVKDQVQEKEKLEEVPVAEVEEIADDESDDDMLEDAPDVSEANSRLGDSFLKGRSINDIVTDQNKLEFKLSNRPVNSIRTAIGINDRFQYIRELFEGSPDKFNETVSTLDSMEDIKEAVHYLRQNFKWKKNETSLKFVNLVKRRFQ